VSELLLQAGRDDFARLIRRRWLRALRVVFICLLLATAIEVFDYRLLMVAVVVMLPSIIAVADPLKLRRWADDLGNTCAVRWEGDRLVINDALRVRFADIKEALSYPDAVIVVTGAPPKRFVVYPLPAPRGEKQERLLAVLRGRNVSVREEGRAPVAGVAVMGLGLIGSLALHCVGAVLAVAGVVSTLAPLVRDHAWPDWTAAAYLVGAVLALTLGALLMPLSAAALAIGQKNKT
jgi:hypothetical protein